MAQDDGVGCSCSVNAFAEGRRRPFATCVAKDRLRMALSAALVPRLFLFFSLPTQVGTGRFALQRGRLRLRSLTASIPHGFDPSRLRSLTASSPKIGALHQSVINSPKIAAVHILSENWIYSFYTKFIVSVLARHIGACPPYRCLPAISVLARHIGACPQYCPPLKSIVSIIAYRHLLAPKARFLQVA